LASQTMLRRAGVSLRVGNVFVVIVLGALLQVVTQIVLARGLPKADVGLISLIVGALPLLSTLTLLGQDTSIVRHLSPRDADRYDLGAYARRTLGIVVPLGATAGFAAGLYYAFPGLPMATIVTLVASQNVVLLLTAFLRARHRYEAAIVARHLPIIGGAIGLAVLFWTSRLSLNTALITLLAAYGLSALIAAALPGHRSSIVGSGERTPVPPHVLRDGFLFLGLGVSLSVMVSIDRLIISRLMTLPDLAVYSTIFAVTKAFDFLFYAVGYVLMPTIGRRGTMSLRRPALAVAAVAVVVAAGYLLFGDELVHLLYAGRYDLGTYLIPAFVLSGVLKLFYSIPSSYINGGAPTGAVRRFMVANLFTMALNVALDIILVRRMGLMGAALATAAAWAMRLAAGVVIMQMYKGRTNSERVPDDPGGP